MDPYNDYHWYRQNPDGTWSHKMRGTEVKNFDSSGVIIWDPDDANRNDSEGYDYTELVGFYYVYPLNLEYIFLTNKWGNPIVVELGYFDHTVSKIHCYSSLWTSTSLSAFKQIEEGMSISEVTSRVGIPFITRTGGKITLNYHSESENEYVIYFNLEKDWTITVESVHIYDPKTKTKTEI